MLAALEDMQNWGIGENDVTLFYYSGHGTQRPGDASDTGTALVGVDSVCPTIKSVQERLDKLPGTVIVILDSCFSGQFIGKAAGEQVTQAEVERFNRSVVSAFSSIQAKNLTGPKYQVITASRGHELSNSAGFLPDGATDESQVVMLGIASYYLSVAGGYDYFAPGSTKLRGDANRDRLVSMKEACAYAEKRVKSWREYINQVWGPNQEDGMQDYPYTTQSVQVWPANSSYPLFGRTTK